MKRVLAGASVLAMLLVGCAPEEPTAPTQPETSAPQENTAVHTWVQDLWLFDRIAYIDDTGAEVDATEEIYAHLAGIETSLSENVADKVVFDAYDSLNPALVNSAGETRPDMTMTAGIMSFDGEEMIAVLATPDSDAADPVLQEDSFKIDLTFLGDRFKPGAPMLFDYTFVQPYPGNDPEPEEPLELLKTRFAEERFRFYGFEGESGAELLMFQSSPGEAVEGSTYGSMPAKDDISEPKMDGFEDGVRGSRKGGLKGVSEFFKGFGRGAKGSNELIDCNLNVGGGGGCGGGGDGGGECEGEDCGKVHGDPHVLTFDGLDYAPQAVGEFVLFESDTLTVQMRTQPLKSSRTVSLVNALAVEANGDRVMMSMDEDGRHLFINDEPVELTRTLTEHSAGELNVFASRSKVRVETPAGEVVTGKFYSLEIIAYVNPGDGTNYAGMLGDADGDPTNDLVTRTGEQLEHRVHKTDPDLFYESFVNSWRITDAESIFTYKEGENTATFTDMTFPDETLSIDKAPADEVALAEKVCREGGVELQPFLDNCIFDYWVTGNTEFLRAARAVSIDFGIWSGEYKLAGEGGSSSSEWPAGYEPEEGVSQERHVRLLWAWDVHSRHTEGDTFEHFCPPLGDVSLGGIAEEIWGGGDIGYTSDTAVCVAALHSGKITANAGGMVKAKMIAGEKSYPAAAPANGITPQTYPNPWGDGYVFE